MWKRTSKDFVYDQIACESFNLNAPGEQKVLIKIECQLTEHNSMCYIMKIRKLADNFIQLEFFQRLFHFNICY